MALFEYCSKKLEFCMYFPWYFPIPKISKIILIFDQNIQTVLHVAISTFYFRPPKNECSQCSCFTIVSWFVREGGPRGKEVSRSRGWPCTWTGDYDEDAKREKKHLQSRPTGFGIYLFFLTSRKLSIWCITASTQSTRIWNHSC